MATILLFVCLLLHLAISFCWLYTIFVLFSKRREATVNTSFCLAPSVILHGKKRDHLDVSGLPASPSATVFFCLNIYEILKNKSKNFAANTSRRDLHWGWELTFVLPIFSQIHLFCVGWKELDQFIPTFAHATVPRHLPRQNWQPGGARMVEEATTTTTTTMTT